MQLRPSAPGKRAPNARIGPGKDKSAGVRRGGCTARPDRRGPPCVSLWSGQTDDEAGHTGRGDRRRRKQGHVHRHVTCDRKSADPGSQEAERPGWAGLQMAVAERRACQAQQQCGAPGAPGAPGCPIIPGRRDERAGRGQLLLGRRQGAGAPLASDHPTTSACPSRALASPRRAACSAP